MVRFPPSPTGLLHMGNVRTALYNYLFAKQNGGQFIIRVEDTDKIRSKKEYEEDMFENMKWLGLAHDNKEVWRQSERLAIYKKYLDKLIASGAAYISTESEGENREVVRFKNPGGKIKWTDLIRGKVEIDVSDLKDFIIARNINEPLYHLAVVIDDMESGVTHIIRGEDHISNTPRQILIYQALAEMPKSDFDLPIYAHLPMILAPDKSKLSKRKHGESVSLKYYRDKGYEKEAILNFIALIGWNPGTEQEIFDLEELIKIFDIKKVQKKGGVFNIEKLDWINREYILRTPPEKQFSIFNSEFSKTKWQNHSKASNKEFIKKFLKIMLDRIHRWGEVSEILETGEFDYLFEKPALDKEKIAWKNQSKEGVKSIMGKVLSIMKGKNYEKIKKEIWELTEKEGKGETLWPLRYALSGREKSPDPFTLIDILGMAESINRIQNAIQLL